MEENTVVAFRNPSDFQDDPRKSCELGRLLAQAVEAEVAEFLEGHATLVDERGRRRIVRNGHLPEADPNRDRPGRRASAACPGSEGRRGRRRHPVHVGDPAALSAPHQEPGGFAAVAILEGHLQRRFLGSVGGVAGGTGPGSVGLHDRTEGSLARRDGALATAWFIGHSATSTSGSTASILAPAWKRRSNASW